MIKEIAINFLQNNCILFLTTICTIIGIPLSTYFYFKSKKEKMLRFEIKSNNIFKDFESIIGNVKVTCDDKSISTLTITSILMWCDGKETIYDKDIATQMPLIVKAKDGKEILEAKIVSCNNQANNITLEKFENNSYKINFEYLDNKDGFIIQVVHTGNSSKDIILNGKIKGMKGNIEKKYPKNNKILKKFFKNKLISSPKMFPYFLFVISLVVMICYIYLLIFKIKELEAAGMELHFIFLAYMLMFILSIRILLKKRRIPKEFQDF